MTFLETCWFCLSSTKLEKSLILSVGEYFYLALPKGPVSNEHVMILPIDHTQAASLLTDDVWKELELFKRALKKYFESNFYSFLFKSTTQQKHNVILQQFLARRKVTVFFERNYKTSHMQINAIGLDKDQEWKIKDTFNEKAEEFGIQFEELPKITNSKDLPENSPYFVVELPDNTTLLTRQMAKFNINFGRELGEFLFFV